ncbi:unnamed protein product [Clavelina lepadiformis]|uniref:Uncharacterized protein n=1 Tax=Clavelina lepadiformis TaxID=159417 RepID=A0ABP0F4D0_CLALP
MPRQAVALLNNELANTHNFEQDSGTYTFSLGIQLGANSVLLKSALEFARDSGTFVASVRPSFIHLPFVVKVDGW